MSGTLNRNLLSGIPGYCENRFPRGVEAADLFNGVFLSLLGLPCLLLGSHVVVVALFLGATLLALPCLLLGSHVDAIALFLGATFAGFLAFAFFVGTTLDAFVSFLVCFFMFLVTASWWSESPSSSEGSSGLPPGEGATRPSSSEGNAKASSDYILRTKPKGDAHTDNKTLRDDGRSRSSWMHWIRPTMVWRMHKPKRHLLQELARVNPPIVEFSIMAALSEAKIEMPFYQQFYHMMKRWAKTIVMWTKNIWCRCLATARLLL